MNVVDSSGWLEYFANGPNADFFAPAIEDPTSLIVPSISIFEVFKRVWQQRSESDALQAAALMQQGQIIDLDLSIALKAAKVSIDFKLPLADSIILATSLANNAILWTQDADFDGLPSVQYKAKVP
ncbi:MAG TPA: type II toxin-antitoxin system VapC family toxin [Blastocatellia bacterium]|jgi:predicted nucleic acid-binding protein|nr:type II toxin-antitoxin system VapC family toxin [Blastocatellia bacterium]